MLVETIKYTNKIIHDNIFLILTVKAYKFLIEYVYSGTEVLFTNYWIVKSIQ